MPLDRSISCLSLERRRDQGSDAGARPAACTSTTVLLNQARVKQKCSSDWVLPPTLCRHERLFFGARRTTTTLCGLSRQPGASRRARRSRGTTQILLHGSAPSRRAQERRAYGGTAGSRQRAADTPVPPSFGRACSVE